MSDFRLWLVIPAVLLIFPQAPALAARRIEIIGDKTSVIGDEEITVTASASGFTEGEKIYIKGAFFQSGSSNYFGYTKGESGWIKNSAQSADQRSVVMGSWDGNIVVKSDFSDSGFTGEGEYLFRLRFYYGDFTGEWSTNTLAVTLNQPDPTITLTPTPKPLETVKPTDTIAPTHTPSPLSTPTKIPTHAPTKFPTTILTFAILGKQVATGSGRDPESGTVSVRTKSNAGPAIFSLGIIGSGLGLVATALAWKKSKESS